MPINRNRDHAAAFPIVAIGASAGGLEALEVFFRCMPADSNMAFVVIQHLSPNYKSNMVSLLSRCTDMTVRQIEDGMAVECNCIYLNPPNANITIFNRTLQLLPFIESRRVNMPIDFFLRALANDQAEKAVAIILSGTATDGTLGIKAIKGEGGMVMVQDPETAKYDGMPRSAIATDVTDIILPAEKMPKALKRYVQHPFIKKEETIDLSETQIRNQLQKIFSLIRNTTGNDFSHYKQNTIRRRIERRLAVHQIENLSDYIEYLQKNPAEIHTLFKDMVIGVTSFFRDAAAYEIIEHQVLPDLLKDKNTNSLIRIWIAGCSTGEEAYSFGILLFEAMEKLNRHFNVKIFASDIDENAIDFARLGIYPKSIAADISPKRLKLFFTKEGDFFKIKKHIREMVVFSLQNLVKDPPFSRLDLVSCRNLMIYMDNVLQKKILPMFHYTLYPKGVLFLGTSESIGENTDLFTPVNAKLKIFTRREGIIKNNIDHFSPNTYGELSITGDKHIKPNQRTADIQSLAEKIILDEYAPSGVVINHHYDILHFIGKTDKYLVPPIGKASFNIMNMARDEIKYKLSSLLKKGIRANKKAVSRNIRIKHYTGIHMLDVSVKPIIGSPPENKLMLVVFDDTTPEIIEDDKQLTDASETDADPRYKSLEQELQSTREYLQATIEELETSNEELKSTNEELQSVNEELQSTNEELETSKEELQSTNEELTTVNSELQNKVNEISKASDDLNNLLAATDIASIFLETNLCIKRFTPAAANIAKLIASDIGRPLNDLKTNFPDEDIVGLAGNVLNDLNTIEIESLSKDNVWYAIKIMPYRTTDNIIDGVVMTFINIQNIKQTDDKMKRFTTLLQDSNDAIIIQDLKGNILAWNKGAEQTYGWTEAEALKMNFEIVISEDRTDEHAKLIGKLLQEVPVPSVTTCRKTKSGEQVNIWLTATLLKDKKGSPSEIATTERNLDWLAAE